MAPSVPRITVATQCRWALSRTKRTTKGQSGTKLPVRFTLFTKIHLPILRSYIHPYIKYIRLHISLELTNVCASRPRKHKSPPSRRTKADTRTCFSRSAHVADCLFPLVLPGCSPSERRYDCLSLPCPFFSPDSWRQQNSPFSASSLAAFAPFFRFLFFSWIAPVA